MKPWDDRCERKMRGNNKNNTQQDPPKNLIDCYEQNWLTRRCGRYTIRPRIATRANNVQRSFLSFLCFNHSLPTFFSWCQFWSLWGGAKFGAYLLLERHPNNLILLLLIIHYYCACWLP
jgi:hypothetical protein